MIYKVAKLRGRVTYKITSIILHIYIYIYIWNIHKYVYCTIKEGNKQSDELILVYQLGFFTQLCSKNTVRISLGSIPFL